MRAFATSSVATCYGTTVYNVHTEQGCSGAGTRGDGVPHFFRQGDASPAPPLFWTEIRANVNPLLQLVTY